MGQYGLPMERTPDTQVGISRSYAAPIIQMQSDQSIFERKPGYFPILAQEKDGTAYQGRFSKLCRRKKNC